MAAPAEVCLRLTEAFKNFLVYKQIDATRFTVLKRTKGFTNGDFYVPKGCLILKPEEVNALIDDIRDFVIKESQSWPTSVFDVRLGSYDIFEIFLDRTSVYASCIEKICNAGDNYGKKTADQTYNILLDLVCGCELWAHEDVTLDDLRSLALAQHMQLLLELQGHHVSLLLAEYHLARLKTAVKMLNIKSPQIFHLNLTDDDIKSFSNRVVCHPCCYLVREPEHDMSNHTESDNTSERRTADLCKIESAKDNMTRTSLDSELMTSSSGLACHGESSYEFNIKQFLEEKGYKRDKNSFDRNLHLSKVISQGKPSGVMKHVITLDRSCQMFDASVCLHIVHQNHAFKLQQVHAVLEASSQKPDRFSQCHFIHGHITHRKDDGATVDLTAEEYFRQRYKQMHDAAVMKYGAAVQGEGWDNTISCVTSAGIKFELLSSVARNNLKLDMGDADDSNVSDSRSGSFVMYNCARLATLFAHFNHSVDKGLYPRLPETKDVDFSTLREETEWTLMFNYVYMYPEIVKQATEEFDPANSLFPKLHTHKICVFLSSLSRCLSSYYSRTHILGENRPHLLPTMYARLYLLKSVHRVMVNGLALLGITALSQL